MNSENRPLVSIITVNYNGRRFLKILLDSLRECTYPNKEIIMVDNASTDDSVQFVKENYPEVIIQQNPENYYFARGNNTGIRISRGKYVLLINNDVRVDPGFMEPVIDLFERYPQLGACQPKVLNLEKPDVFEYAGGAGGYLDALGYPFLKGRIFFTLERDEGQYNHVTGLFWASGAALFLRKRMLDDVGLLDEDFKLHMEEIDMCWRLRENGWDILLQPASRIWHHGGGTLPQKHPQKMYWNFRNNIFLLVKNFSFLNLLWRLPLRIILDMTALGMELVKLHPLNSLAIIRAYGWIISHLPMLVRKRRQVQSRRTVNDRQVLKRLYPGSIVLEYFLFKKQKFTDLFFFKKFNCQISAVDLKLNSVSKKGVENIYEQ